MTTNATLSLSPPGIDVESVQKRKLIEAERFSLEAQLRDFERLGRRLVAGGKDATAAYGAMVKRHDALTGTLSRPARPELDPSRTAPRLDQPLAAVPIAPANFLHGIETGYGSSGTVQVGVMADGVSVVPGGSSISGSIGAPTPTQPGRVTFGGRPIAGPHDPFDPSIRHWWLHNWSVLVPFAVQTFASDLTYRFEISVEANVLFEGGNGTFMSWVALGETANLVNGSAIVPQFDGGWPVMQDLTQPASSPANGLYNGHYGSLLGRTTVQRTFLTGGGLPAIAIVIGAVVGLSDAADVTLSFDGSGSSITLLDPDNGQTGRVAFHFAPRPILHQ